MGSDYTVWVDSIKKYGYDFDYRILNSADLVRHSRGNVTFPNLQNHRVSVAHTQ
jgi:hypothetical protein